jgi:hypothetical protein
LWYKAENTQRRKTMKRMRARTILLALAAVVGLSTGTNATPVDWNQILYKFSPVGGLTAEQAQNLNAAIEMTFDSGTGLLMVFLTNTSGNTTGTTANASNVLTGVGFSLPAGVSVLDNAAHNSMIALKFGSAVYSGTFSQDMWGWGTTIAGHYDDPGVLPVNLILSTNSADADTTFGGAAASTLNGPTYGLISRDGSPANGARIVDTLVFSIYLANVPTNLDLPQFIQNRAVVVAYGSPTNAQGQYTPYSPPPPPPPAVPEPASMLLMGAGLMTWGVLRRRKRKAKS